MPLAFQAIGWTSRTVGAIWPRPVGWLLMHLFRTPLGNAKPRESDLMDAEQIRVPFAGGEVAVYSWGEGPTVMLVHGWRAHAGRWRKLIPELVNAGYRVLAVDIPAHGNSEGQRTDPYQTAIALNTIATQFGPLHAVVAHSFGAASTALMLNEFPNVPVDRVVLLGCPNDMRDIMVSFAKILRLPEKVLEAMVDAIGRKAGRPVQGQSTSNWLRNNRRRGLLVHDREDEVISFDSAEIIAREWGSAELLPTTSLGHDKTLYDPAVIQKIITFLSEK